MERLPHFWERVTVVESVGSDPYPVGHTGYIWDAELADDRSLGGMLHILSLPKEHFRKVIFGSGWVLARFCWSTRLGFVRLRKFSSLEEEAAWRLESG